MINQRAKKELLNRLEQHYIPPLTEFYVFCEILKRKLEGRPSRRAIAVPDSWRTLSYQQVVTGMSAEDAYHRLVQLLSYLDKSAGLVFARDAELLPNHSVPYFEWLYDNRLEGIHHLIGAPQLLYFYKGNDEGLQQLLENIVAHHLTQHFSVVGILPDALQTLLKEHQIRLINNIDIPFIEQLLRTRSLTGFFNQGIDLILLDTNSVYRKGFSRTEWLKNSTQFYQEYFTDQFNTLNPLNHPDQANIKINASVDKTLEHSE